MRAGLAGVMMAVLALAACRADSRFVLFSSDVFDVAAGKGAAPVSALYRVEISSLSDCAEQKGRDHGGCCEIHHAQFGCDL
ncbi:hypothetical protein [Phaeovulum sp.]|uniref:hypothetical protein n=1 Tax=Phaeovulum sp. TaxID=2934796 RepID=UPI003561A0AB